MKTVYRCVYRFVGDPTGYLVERGDRPPTTLAVKWVEAKVGRTDKTVWIDPGEAYMAEEVRTDYFDEGVR